MLSTNAEAKTALKAKAAKAKPAKRAKAKNAKAGQKGVFNSAKFGGKRMFPTERCAEGNPRRKGSHGERCLQIVIDNPGITYEEYRAKGGRYNEVVADLKMGNIELRKR